MQGITPEMLIMMLDLCGIEIVAVIITEKGELHIKIKSIVVGTACHCCGTPIDKRS